MPKIRNWSKLSDTFWKHDEKPKFKVRVVESGSSDYDVKVMSGERTLTSQTYRTKERATDRAVSFMKNNPNP